jgi:hypothetical protein
VLEFLDSAKSDGRIRYPAFSFHDQFSVFKEIVDAYEWTFAQIQYNYMDEQYQAGTQGLRYAAERGLGIVVMEPLRAVSSRGTFPQSASISKTSRKNIPVLPEMFPLHSYLPVDTAGIPELVQRGQSRVTGELFHSAGRYIRVGLMEETGHEGSFLLRHNFPRFTSM